MLGKVVLFRGRPVECNKVYLRSLCVLCGKRNENTCKPQKRAETTQRNCLSRSSSDEVSLNHKMTLVTDGGEQDRDAVASFDLTFKDAHQIF